MQRTDADDIPGYGTPVPPPRPPSDVPRNPRSNMSANVAMQPVRLPAPPTPVTASVVLIAPEDDSLIRSVKVERGRLRVRIAASPHLAHVQRVYLTLDSEKAWIWTNEPTAPARVALTVDAKGRIDIRSISAALGIVKGSYLVLIGPFENGATALVTERTVLRSLTRSPE